MLRTAWSTAKKSGKDKPNVLILFALGGAGKTALVAKWAVEQKLKGWPGCDAAFAWSFYTQGTREQGAASSDLFLTHALSFFGDRAPDGKTRTAFDKGRELARLVGKKRALVFLDGLEPFQCPPTRTSPGQLRDPGLAALLKGLAEDNRGLCVITTRHRIPELEAYGEPHVRQRPLDRLSDAAGESLLRSLGVHGTSADLQAVVERFKGHALALKMLGAYLRDAHHGDVRKHVRVRLREVDEAQGGHAFRVMDAYVRWLAPTGFWAWFRRLFSQKDRKSQEEGRRAVAVLRLLGLFDRPATPDCLDALLTSPAVQRLNTPLAGMSEEQRNIALTRLDDAQLLTDGRRKDWSQGALDVHPLVREYFATWTLRRAPAAWRAGHQRLFEHLKAKVAHYHPEAPGDFQLLYQASAHGCQAGSYPAAWEVYWRRINRESSYAGRWLGWFGEDLAALGWFFEDPWLQPVAGLPAETEALLFDLVGSRLRATGELAKAADVNRTALARYQALGDFRWAAHKARHLSDVHLALGRLAESVEHARQGVALADESTDPYERFTERAVLGAALHFRGKREEARLQFADAERILPETGYRGLSQLYTLWGFRYCDLLLDLKEYQAVRGRAAWMRQANRHKLPSQDPENGLGLLSIALEHLLVGRVGMAELETGAGNPGVVRAELDRAVEELIHAGRQDFIPLGYLARAAFHRLQRNFNEARSDLREARGGADRCGMQIYVVDCLLEEARQKLADGRKDECRPLVEQAEHLIAETGYSRRTQDVTDLGC